MKVEEIISLFKIQKRRAVSTASILFAFALSCVAAGDVP
jgi:hypothetical protein